MFHRTQCKEYQRVNPRSLHLCPTHVVTQRGLCVRVSVLVTLVNSAKTAKPIQMPFGRQARESSRSHTVHL